MNSLSLMVQCGTIASIAYFIKCKPNFYRNSQNNTNMTIRMNDTTAAFLYRYDIMNKEQLHQHSMNKDYRGEITLLF